MNYADLADLMDEIRAAELEGDLVTARELVLRALALAAELEASLVDGVDARAARRAST
ncbi:MAG: hypothetical protein KF878_00180 [Planctomycetes bacterium]|nr:hypothetical protein [Planctomycetota bacterium]